MPMGSGHRLRNLALAILVLNAALAVLAIALNWPAQFGGVGEDAGSEFLTRGTAISAPLLPVLLLVVVAVFAARRDRWQWLGVAAAYLTAVVVAIGGVGELLADPTEDTPRAALVLGGFSWLIAAAVLVATATAVVAGRRRPAAESLR